MRRNTWWLSCSVALFAIAAGCGGTDGTSSGSGASGSGAGPGSGGGTTTGTMTTGTGGEGGSIGNGGAGGMGGSIGNGGSGGTGTGGMGTGGMGTGGMGTGGMGTGGMGGGNPVCATDADCDDGVSCTVDACDPATMACTYMPMDALCDNNVACDGMEFCNALLGCLSMGAPSCDDGVPCTSDFCDLAADTCAHVPEDSACTNGQFCDGVETCHPTTGCQPGAPVICNDGIACTMDACNEAMDSCVYAPNDAACADASYCNGAEVCSPGVGCVPGAPVVCNDSRSCTTDVCSEAQQGCVTLPNHAACNDGMYCNGVETCSSSGPTPTGCVAGSAVACPSDGITCTTDACDEPSQSCTSTPNSAMCPQGQTCVVQQGGCTAAQPCLDSAQCQDGNACNGAEVCSGGVCQAGQPVNCNDQIGCTVDSCNPANGQCVHTPNNAACDDGFACNGVESCDAQMGCVATPAPNCNDGVACTFDQCQEPTGTCVNFPQDYLCSDGQLCNGAETCNAQLGCQPAAAPHVCPDDGIACTVSTCNAQLNTCINAPQNNLCPCGQTCSAQDGGCGNFCTVKTCQGKVYACGDCLDNDGDCKIDDADDQCLGPCDNTENSFYGGIPGQNNSPCKADCYFDQDTGSGNDDCYWSYKCDPLEVAPNYPPAGSQCSYNPGASIPGYGGSCAQAFASQSATCLGYCGTLTPNGCDCFGCCSIPGLAYTVWLGSENPAGTGSCNANTLQDPTMCKPCTQVQACLNTCGNCEICIGKPDLPPECQVQECPPGAQACGQPGQPFCPDGASCITGCCQANPQ